jgi:hypothetical protein
VQTIDLANPVVIIGRRGQGSTTLVHDVLHSVRRRAQFTDGWVFLARECDKQEWSETLPPDNISCNYYENKDKLWEIIEYQRRRTERLPNGKPPHVFIVLDQVICDHREFLPNRGLQNLMVQGSCLNIFVCILMQYPIPMDPFLKAYVGYTTFLLNPPTAKMVDDFCKKYYTGEHCFPRLPLYHAWVVDTEFNVHTYKATQRGQCMLTK